MGSIDIGDVLFVAALIGKPHAKLAIAKYRLHIWSFFSAKYEIRIKAEFR
jgi:hypothetical protein